MQPSSTIPQDLLRRIDHWAQEVEKHNQRLHQISAESVHSMNLRARPTRQALAEISNNPYPRKRKAALMDNTDNAKAEAEDAGLASEPRKRGRPLGSKNKTGPLVLEAPASSTCSSARRKKSGSPTKAKRGEKTFEMSKPETAIDMAYLARCHPPIKQKTFVQLLAAERIIPRSVLYLHEKLSASLHGVVPSELKKLYKKDADTPRKSMAPVIDSLSYLEPSKTPFPAERLGQLKELVERVYHRAETNHNVNAHERQWGALVHRIMCEVELWSKKKNMIVVLNVENCSISPRELKPLRPDATSRIDLDAQSVSTYSEKTDTPENIGRMVDWCLGLEVSDDALDEINKAWTHSADYEHSLNQSSSYIHQNPLFLDIEIKKRNANRDPQVQLAVWEAASYLKKKYHGWDTSLPMPAISIDGHYWVYYLFFALDGEIMMVGPMDFGNTASVNGIWTILHRLHILMEWGQTEYAQCFQDHVMKWARDWYSTQKPLGLPG